MPSNVLKVRKGASKSNKTINMDKLPKWFKDIIAGSPQLKVVVPLRVFQAHVQMSRIWMGKGEYSTLMEMRDEGSGVYRVVDYLIPYQDAGHGFARLNKRGAINLAVNHVDRLEHIYGVYHIHPGYSDYVPGMSGVDVSAMWTWISNAERGIFIVANSAGQMSAVFVGKDNGQLFQLPMDVEIDWSMEDAEVTTLEALMEDRVSTPSYQYYAWPKVRHVPARRTSLKGGKQKAKAVKTRTAATSGEDWKAPPIGEKVRVVKVPTYSRSLKAGDLVTVKYRNRYGCRVVTDKNQSWEIYLTNALFERVEEKAEELADAVEVEAKHLPPYLQRLKRVLGQLSGAEVPDAGDAVSTISPGMAMVPVSGFDERIVAARQLLYLARNGDDLAIKEVVNQGMSILLPSSNILTDELLAGFLFGPAPLDDVEMMR